MDYDHSVIPLAFRRFGVFDVLGRLGELHLRTVLEGEPWSSDFGYWMRLQRLELQHDLDQAVGEYLEQHGPGRWAFDLPQTITANGNLT